MFNNGETIYRHGDVMLRKHESSDSFDHIPIAVEALLHKGQNNHHRIRGEFRLLEGTEKLLAVLKPTELYHEEHATIIIEPGLYKVDIQLEYDHWSEESRQVID